MYFFSELKRVLKNRRTIIIISISILLMILSFISLKTKYFYELINYIPDYIEYYYNQYLGGSIEDLISNNKLFLFIENDLMKIFSSLYIFFITQYSVFFKILSYLMPIFIFYIVHVNLFDEIYCDFFKNITRRIGKKKYFFQKISMLSIVGGIIVLLPKIVYCLLLTIFFVNGVSDTHYIINEAFVPSAYLFTGNGLGPTSLLLVDLAMTFIYGVIVSLISVCVIFFCNKKISSFLYFIFILFFQAVLSYICLSYIKIIPFPPIFVLYSVNEYILLIQQDFSLLYFLMHIFIWFVILIPLIIKMIRSNFKELKR